MRFRIRPENTRRLADPNGGPVETVQDDIRADGEGVHGAEDAEPHSQERGTKAAVLHINADNGLAP